MLLRLQIENYGLIERAEIRFAQGATMFTGETGSGKTMILGALAFALGARASADDVRPGAARANVTLTFEPDGVLRERLSADGYPIDPGEEASFVRELTDAGKSSVRVNGRPSTAAYVRDLGESIVEIVGQHEAQRLLSPAYHLELLDRFAGARAIEARASVARACERVQQYREELDSLRSDERAALQRYEDARYALEEIDAAAPWVGEDERLSERRRYLDNVERIAATLRLAHEAIASDEAGAQSSLGSAASALNAIAPIGGTLREMAESAASLQSETNELALRIARALDDTEFDPVEAENVSARLDTLDRLKRKYGGSIEAILASADDMRRVVNRYESREERVAELSEALASAQSQLGIAAAALTKIRTSAAQRLSKSVLAEFKDLALASGRLDVEFDTIDPGPNGAESVQFVFAANAGEPLRPLSRVASGGELSRVLLALVVALAAARDRTALVFDEIDAGIGGATGTAVGTRIGRLARDGQVVCVTHLAQLATWAGRHYVLEKRETKGSTTITVREIEGNEARAAELARMLSGEPHAVALEHARTLLQRASTV
jgi:DNA repair protein RecN (Recombination protein N)